MTETAIEKLRETRAQLDALRGSMPVTDYAAEAERIEGLALPEDDKLRLQLRLAKDRTADTIAALAMDAIENTLTLAVALGAIEQRVQALESR